MKTSQTPRAIECDIARARTKIDELNGQLKTLPRLAIYADTRKEFTRCIQGLESLILRHKEQTHESYIMSSGRIVTFKSKTKR